MQGTGAALQREAAIRQYGPMVKRVAAQMVSRLPANVEVDDLVQAGMIGLFDSLSRYQAELGAQFETFAMQRIRGAMIDELRGSDWLPRSVRRSQRTIDGAIRRLEQCLQRPPAEREVAEALGVALDEYQRMLGQARGIQLVCLDELSDNDFDENIREHPGAPADGDPSEMLRDERFRDALLDAIDELPERERMLMGMYYEREMNLKEIGAVLGVTESRVSQLHTQGVARLRVKLRGWT
jgi:RNA polymerase sigma factor for flagellar operon FliA